MILSRVIKHFRQQEWTAIGIDFLIVVLGVFIGIQFANWNQYASDRHDETQYLRQLQDDLHNIQAEVDAQIEFEQFQVNLTAQTFNLIRNDTSDDRALKIDMGLRMLMVRRTLRTQSPTFLNLQGSGKLDIISDPDLRAAIISYFYSTARLEAAIDKNNAVFIDGAYADFIMSNRIPPRRWDDGLMSMELPPSAQISSEFKEKARQGPIYDAEGGSLAMPPDSEFWDEVIAQLSWRGYISTNNEALVQHLAAATEALESELADHLERRAP